MSSLKKAALRLAQEVPEFRDALKTAIQAEESKNRTAGYQGDLRRASPSVYVMEADDGSDDVALVLDGIPPVGDLQIWFAKTPREVADAKKKLKALMQSAKVAMRKLEKM